MTIGVTSSAPDGARAVIARRPHGAPCMPLADVSRTSHWWKNTGSTTAVPIPVDPSERSDVIET